MNNPSIKLLDDNGIPINSSNPLVFGDTPAGITSAILSMWIWNDRGAVLGSLTANAPRVIAISVPDDMTSMLIGTIANGMQSMVEARSCQASGTYAENQSSWTPIRPDNPLFLAPIPSNCARQVQLRINSPIDAVSLTPSKHFQLQVDDGTYVSPTSGITIAAYQKGQVIPDVDLVGSTDLVLTATMLTSIERVMILGPVVDGVRDDITESISIRLPESTPNQVILNSGVDLAGCKVSMIGPCTTATDLGTLNPYQKGQSFTGINLPASTDVTITATLLESIDDVRVLGPVQMDGTRSDITNSIVIRFVDATPNEVVLNSGVALTGCKVFTVGF